MDRVRVLEADVEAKKKQVKGILGGAAKDKRNLTTEEAQSVEAFAAELDQIQATLKAERQLVEWDRNGAPAIDRPAGEAPPRHAGGAVNGRKYAELFGAPAPGPFAKNEEFFGAVHAAATRGIYDPRLGEVLAAMNTAVGSEGGFAIPAPLAATWLDIGLESEVVRPRATVYPMTADSLDVPGWDDFDHSGGSIAGFKASWAGELSSYSSTDGKLRKIELKALKLLVSTQLSNEMLADGGMSFQNELERKMPQAVSWTLDDRFINGTGAGQVLGLLNDPALITVTKETSQVAATFVLENALKMFERMYPGGYANAVWVVNHSVIPQLYMLVLKVRNVANTENVGGSAVPYFSVGADGSMRLLGLPVVVTEKCSALGTKGDVLLTDLSQYALGLRQDILLETSRHAGWTTDSTFYRAVLRVAGMGTWLKPLTSKAGSTRSWVVTIETR